jgi:hypothetical protein
MSQLRPFKFAVLEVLASSPTRREHRETLLGRPKLPGKLEEHLQITFSEDDGSRSTRRGVI